LGLFTLLAYFGTTGWLIRDLRALLSGLLGWGFFIAPPTLLGVAAILAFHRGRPVALRVTCLALVPILIGALIHLFSFGMRIDFGEGGVMSELWNTGQELESGGLIGGVIAAGLQNMLSTVGAVILLLLILGFLGLTVSNRTVADVIEWFKNREKLDYEPEPDYDEGPIPPARSAPPPRSAPLPAQGPRRPQAIDIPLDGEIRPKAQPSESRRGRKPIKLQEPNVATPDQLFDAEDIMAARRPAPRAGGRFQYDVPLDGEGRIPEVKETPIVPNLTHFQQAKSPPPTSPAPPAEEKAKPQEVAAAKADIARDIEASLSKEQADYKLPTVNLLKQAKGGPVDGAREVNETAERLGAALDSFGVEASIVSAVRGPTVTRYELELEPGYRLSKLVGLSGDLALNLGAVGVRIAPVPVKISTVGVEVPNKERSTVYLREIIESENFQTPSGKLTFALGKDISGTCIVGDIAKLPHLLIAGTTGSGKSVTVNGLILSILFRARPDEVKLIMIDPKMVEFGKYNGVPHLLIPVVTDPKKAAGALQWAVTEMLKRYKTFSEVGAKDLFSYNRTAAKEEELEPFPQLVVVIDELADLMMTAAKEVEDSICRVAQMGRAAGVHLVVSTQRPSANVITGLMKANIPSRIALSVSSAMESRIIMDDVGAEKLVGNGDMLYKPIGEKPTRIQGAYVDEAEIEKVIDFLKKDADPEYDASVDSFIENAAADKTEAAPKEEGPLSDYDEMFGDAVNVILDLGQASTSVLQRRLKLGYSRAGRLMDQLEEAGIVGAHRGSKPREVLISRAQWQAMREGGAPEAQDTAFDDIPKDDFSAHQEEAAEAYYE